MACRGFTLVEVVVALGLTLIVTGSMHRLLVTTQRLSRVQSAQVNLQSSLRAGALVIASEVRELNGVVAGSSDQTDILSITGSSMTYRAARGMGFLCEPPAAGHIRIAQSTFTGFRSPQPSRDAAYLFVEGNPEAGVKDAWLPLPIASVATTSGCPGAAGPAISIALSSPAPIVAVPAGTPLRIYETMELRLYQSDGQWWLGARSVSAGEAIQPVIGPLAGSDALRLEYLNGAGIPTTEPAAIKSIVATLRGTSEQLEPPGSHDRLEQELATQITLRNATER
jgi:prepilin-type N-terminal cleavage/methylation domain-containing protein